MKRKPVAVVHCPPHLRPGMKARVIRRFNTIRQAEAYIARIEKRHPVEVYRGEFGVDAPEWMLK